MRIDRKSYIVGALIGLASAGIALLLCSHAVRPSLPGQLLWRLELVSYDFRTANSAPNLPSDKVVIVTIDEESMAQLGVWPWPRRYHARVLDRLAEAGARVVGLDMILSTVSNPNVTAESAKNKPLDWEPPPGTDDLIFEKALKSAGNTVLAVSLAESHVQRGDAAGDITEAQFPYWRFEDAARAISIVNIPKDVDGTIRRCFLDRTYQEDRYFSMPLMLSAIYLGRDPAKVVSDAASGLGSRRSDGFLISCRGRPGVGFRQIPYYQVLRKELTPDLARQVRGKIVLVGATANALQDRHDTPLSLGMRRGGDSRQSTQMPGVEVMANAVDTILRSNYIRPAKSGLIAILACILSLITAMIVVRLRPLPALAVGWLPGQVMVLILSLILWQSFRLWMPLVALSLGVTLSYVCTTIYLELTTERRRRSMQQSWARRVSPEVLQVIFSTPSLAHVNGRLIEATVMFTDLRGFTTFCHESPPQEVVESLNECLGLVTSVIRKHGGTVHKFIGDGVMAVFGDPVPQDDHARRAVSAACELQREMGRLRRSLPDGRWVPYLRIGIHTGDLVAGDIGSAEMLEYTVIGDTVSTASRLESLNKEYGTDIMISKATLDEAGDGFKVQALGTAEIRGRGAMEVYAVLSFADGSKSQVPGSKSLDTANLEL